MITARATRRTLAAASVVLGLLFAPASAVATPGFVEANGAAFSLNGQRWQPIGFNQYRLTSMPGGYVCGSEIDQASLEARLDDMKAAGANVVRTWFFQSYFLASGWAPFDRVLTAASRRGMSVIPTLVNQYASDCEPPSIEKNHGFYANAFQFAGFGYPYSFEAYARMVAEHYADNRAVAFWQLVNEAQPQFDSGCPGNGTALRSFVDELRSTLRSVDANHLVSLGTIGGAECGSSSDLGNLRDYAYVHEGADICEIHDSAAPANPMPGDNTNGVARRIAQCNELGKPIFVGKAAIPADVGADGTSTGTIDDSTLTRRADFFQAKIEAQFAAGMDGYLIWEKILGNSDAQTSGDRYGVGHPGTGTTEDPVANVVRGAGLRPSPRIDSGPSGLINSPPTYTFSASAPGSGFDCRVDLVAFAACTSPHAPAALADGPHTFEVRATHPLATPDPTPARASFTLDTVAPDTTITAGPSDGSSTSDATPTFAFVSSETPATFRCRLERAPASGAFTACATPFTSVPLSDGVYGFCARAVDRASNADGSPACRRFTVDTVAPDTTITAGPSDGSSTSDATPTFAFVSSESPVTFRCRLERAPASGVFTACATPFTSVPLSDGVYGFCVRAVDRASNADGSPACRRFTVQAQTRPSLPATPPAPESAQPHASRRPRTRPRAGTSTWVGRYITHRSTGDPRP